MLEHFNCQGLGLLLARLVGGAVLTPTETSVLWGLHHPYWLVAIAIFVIILLQIGISILGQLLRRVLRWLSRSPFFLGRWLLARTTLRDCSEEQQLRGILQRLDSLQEEQARLLLQLRERLPDGE